jgi:hypothetical protein
MLLPSMQAELEQNWIPDLEMEQEDSKEVWEQPMVMLPDMAATNTLSFLLEQECTVDWPQTQEIIANKEKTLKNVFIFEKQLCPINALKKVKTNHQPLQ